jgi:CHAD domain-containing protein
MCHGSAACQTWQTAPQPMTLDVPTCAYLLAAGTDPDALLTALRDDGGAGVEAGAADGWTTWTLLDTADRRLRAAGLDAHLVERPGGPVLQLAEGEPRSGPSVPVAPARRWLSDDIPDGPVRRRLAPVLGIRALLPVVRLRRRDRRFVVRNADAKIVVRGRLVQAQALPSNGSDGDDGVELRSRVELSGVLGYAKPFARLRTVLHDDLGLDEVTRPLADEAALAVGEALDGIPSKPSVELRPRQRTDDAALAVLRSMADVAEANLAGTLADLDTEFLHDLRVAVRRSRSVLRELKRALPDKARRAHADSLRWVQAVTGPTRDLDVQLLEWDDLIAQLPEDRRTHLAPVRSLLAEHRAAAFAELQATLQGEEYATRWEAWRSFLTGDLGPDKRRRDAVRPIREVAARRVDRVYRRMQKMGAAIDDTSPAQDLHDLRKRGKELRYLLELFGDVLRGKAVRPMVAALKGLQDVLGRHQDREVQAAQLRGLAPELARTASEHGPDALLAMGALVDRLEADQAEARRGFAERFDAFRSLEVPT